MSHYAKHPSAQMTERFIIALALAGLIGHVHAAELRQAQLSPDGHSYGKLVDSDILEMWSLANEACMRRTRGACEERDAIDREMPPRGYCYADDHWSKCDAAAAAATRPKALPPPEPEPAPYAKAKAPPLEPVESAPMGGADMRAACALLRRAAFRNPIDAAQALMLCPPPRLAARWVWIDPDHGRWERAPAGPAHPPAGNGSLPASRGGEIRPEAGQSRPANDRQWTRTASSPDQHPPRDALRSPRARVERRLITLSTNDLMRAPF
jgi:hypothetical protein